MILKLNEAKIAVIGLGYVGLPLAVEFSKKYPVVGFDLDSDRVRELKKGYDRTHEISDEKLLNLNQLTLSCSLESIADSNVYIISVPTPVDKNNKPNLNSIISASEMIGSLLSENNYVIYESTVFPGCTEEICIPILEKFSGKKYNKDFFCGYSPERINPGDKEHTLTQILKITSGGNFESSEFIDSLYSSIISAGTYKVSSISVAEAAKVIENTQRDVNIALINELSIIFNKMNIDTHEVLDAASTKWNFLPFTPGLVGGHCIGVDPYYLTHKAMEVGHHPEIILAGRKINDNIGYFIAENTIAELAKKGISPIKAKIAILGLTFKENCPDLRNTKVITIIEQLAHYKCSISVSDNWADSVEAEEQLNLNLVDLDKVANKDAIIIAVGHDIYKDFSNEDLQHMLRPNGVLIDVKSLYPLNTFSKLNITHWRL
tara:strand:+ start:8505 stop:9803 length:1299 start_codon:yes stop_codon:yes gene_type:complete